MTREEAIVEIEKIKRSHGWCRTEAIDMAIEALENPIPSFAINYLKEGLDKAKEQYLADGCRGCAFSDVEEWQEPCRMCARNCKDYWRAKA